MTDEPKLPNKAPQALANGRYELLEFIGKGGMGAVYRARDVELDRSVAVKCLLDVDRQGSRQLAVKEARTLASLSHPNIMRVFDILSVGDQVWIVSEWLEGKCLSQLPLPLPPSCVLAVMTQVYDALAAAHSAQVIHRDIKPSNVMIGKDGRVSLIDFGVAYAPGASTGETMVGSLRYTDPRILEGEPPDALSDLFSAALLQVELMTGETVLPDLAPLPLYRHIKRSLEGRLDALLDGAYPPLVNIARRFTCRRGDFDLSADPSSAREAALLSLDALRKLTQKTPEGYLGGGLCRGAIVDPLADQVINSETSEALQSTLLTPKQKAAWVAFKVASESGGRTAKAAVPHARKPHSETAEHRHATTYHARRHLILPPRRWAWAAGTGFAALVIAGIITWLMLDHTPAATPALVTQPVATTPTIATIPAIEQVPIAPETHQEPTKPKTVPVHLVANAWAIVRIDGHEVGRLPQAAPFALTPGAHTLELSNPAVEPLTTTIQIAMPPVDHPTRTQRLHFSLQPKVTPRLIKLAQPGELYIDGKDQGVVSEKRVALSYGAHQLLVRRGGKIIKVMNVALGPDSPLEIKAE